MPKVPRRTGSKNTFDADLKTLRKETITLEQYKRGESMIDDKVTVSVSQASDDIEDQTVHCYGGTRLGLPIPLDTLVDFDYLGSVEDF